MSIYVNIHKPYPDQERFQFTVRSFKDPSFVVLRVSNREQEIDFYVDEHDLRTLRNVIVDHLYAIR